jgi:hypothetical protein
MTPTPTFTFLSSVRRGLAAAIAQDDKGTVPGHVSLEATAATTAGAAQPIDLRLMGPGEITGVDRRVLLPSFPKPGETSHPPHLFVTLELDRPELPWLFTPARAFNDRLRPWLGLVVVEAASGNAVTIDANKPLPTLHVDDVKELPDLTDAWAWAHVAVTGSLSDPDDVADLITAGPERVVARLVCPRRLDPASSYIAALVPLFASGRDAGLGAKVDDAAALAPAWDRSKTGPVDLPVYHHWEFSTGPVGDFRSLALLLHYADPLPALGSRPVDITDPGGGLTPLSAGAVTRKLGLEGAMRLPGATPTTWDAIEQAAFEQALTALIDAANLAAAGLGPPLYGRWLAGETTVPTATPQWLRDLNLDPRQRIAAGLGALIVSNQREQLLAQAWAQVGEIERANAALRQAQLARAHLRPIHTLLAGTSTGTFLSLTSPLHDRVLVKPLTARGVVAASSFPQVALGAAFRRLARPRGRFGRRLARSGDPGTLLARLARADVAVAPPPAAPDGSAVGAPRAVRLKAAQITTQPGVSGWKPLGESDPLPDRRDFGPDSAEAAAFRNAAADWATWLDGFAKAPQPNVRPALDAAALRDEIFAKLDPDATVPRRTLSRIAVGSWDGGGDKLEPVLAAPRFPQPMWEALRALSQQYVLPGIDKLEPNTLLLAEPNAPFIEAFMVGLNHEIGRLLLFAEFPTDQRGTCFREFWDPRGQVPSPAPGTTDDIDAIDGWDGGGLGTHLATADLDMLVLLIRGDLLHRFPNTTIYAAPAVWTGAVGTHTRAPDPDESKELYPLFRGSLAPDITFVCFSPLDADTAKGVAVQSSANDPPGWFFVFQQHSTEPHLGLGAPSGRKQGVPADPDSIAWDDFADANGNLPDFAPTAIPSWWSTLSWGQGPKWGAESASTAALSLQRPVRVAFHASELLPA